MSFHQQISQPPLNFATQQQTSLTSYMNKAAQPQVQNGSNVQLDSQEHDMNFNQNDSASKVKFSPQNSSQVQVYQTQQFLAVSCWDGTISIYKVDTQIAQTPKCVNQISAKTEPVSQKQCNGPILSFCWRHDKSGLILALADHTIMLWDLQSDNLSKIGEHQAPVKDVFSIDLNSSPVVISGGWDSQVCFWKWQTINNNQQQPQQQQEQLSLVFGIYVAMPVHYMSCQFPLLVTAHADRLIHVWNLNQCAQTGDFNPHALFETNLKYATSSVECFPNGKGYMVGSIEGRCQVVNIDFSIKIEDIGKNERNFNFKCHQVLENNMLSCYQVNGFAFNKQYGTFMSYGSDGKIALWNKDLKRQYKNFNRFSLPVVAGDMSDDGTLICYAIGYDWSKGVEELKQKQYLNKLIMRTPVIAEEIFNNK